MKVNDKMGGVRAGGVGCAGMHTSAKGVSMVGMSQRLFAAGQAPLGAGPLHRKMLPLACRAQQDFFSSVVSSQDYFVERLLYHV